MVEIISIKATEADEIEEPATLQEVKRWANVEHGDDDAMLFEMIIAARQDVELETGLKLVPHAVELHVSTTNGSELVNFPYGVATEMVVADDEDETLAIDSDYSLKRGGLVLNGSGYFKVTYTVGNNCPQGLKEAILMLVTYRYNNRGDQEKQQGLPEDIASKLSKYRKVWL